MALRIAYVHGGGDVPVEIEALRGRGEFDVAVTDVGALPLRSAFDADTDCLVADHEPPAVDALELTALARDVRPQLPVVCFPTEPTEHLAVAALNAGVDAFVPDVDGTRTGILANQVRRVSGGDAPDVDKDADGAAMLDSLLTSLPRWVSIYFKDRRGRHVAISGSQHAFDEDTVVHTPDGKVLHSREDILGKTDFDLYPADLAVETRRDEAQILNAEEPIVDRTEVVDEPHGPRSYYSTTKAPWYDTDGTLLGIVGITVDITERERRRHALERQNERLDRFAGVLSHDLRNPLNVARGQLDIALEHEDLKSSVRDPLGEVDWALGRIEELVADTLELARQGSAVEDPEPTDVAAVAREAWRACGGDRARLECDPDLPTIQASPERLQTLLENLFRNAHEHGGEAVTVGVLPTADGFAVADDGPGIPPEEHEEVFEEGYTTEAEGTGFGLAIVRDVATAHGWTVSVAESADGGARFEFGDVTRVED